LDALSVAALASAVLTILSVLLGTKYRAGKAKAKQLAKLLSTVVAAAEVAAVTGKSRAVESAYLNQLAVMKVVSKCRCSRKAVFQVVSEVLTGEGQAVDC
jgi:archaellum biogenesis protein FlaJ (TadC family)